MGSWEAIKMDASLELGDKIFPNGSKVQLKRVNARAEYLLKILKKQIDLKLGVVRSFCVWHINECIFICLFIFQQDYVFLLQLETEYEVIP